MRAGAATQSLPLDEEYAKICEAPLLHPLNTNKQTQSINVPVVGLFTKDNLAITFVAVSEH